ncbi:DUF6907 domain-containing protein [Streptomyces sp. NPDC058240]|uniref:DUF6907 domain-containing protein n=1 Tax=Streptomyces sp. NPDC058240 TaxID=3346396 RepID=UPI0036E36DFF
MAVRDGARGEPARHLTANARQRPRPRSGALRYAASFRARSGRSRTGCRTVMQDSWIEGLDPDGLETVIGTLAERVEQLRTVHAQLVKARAEYR